jgi:hypothetical protein
MGNAVLPSICLARAQAIENLVESWQPDHHTAMYARDLEELVRECVGLRRLAERTWNFLRDALQKNEVCDIYFTGKIQQTAVKRHLRLYAAVREHIRVAKQLGYEIEGEEEFTKAEQYAKYLSEALKQEWPWLDPETARRADADYKEGRFRPAEGFFDELRHHIG